MITTYDTLVAKKIGVYPAIIAWLIVNALPEGERSVTLSHKDIRRTTGLTASNVDAGIRKLEKLGWLPYDEAEGIYRFNVALLLKGLGIEP